MLKKPDINNIFETPGQELQIIVNTQVSVCISSFNHVSEFDKLV